MKPLLGPPHAHPRGGMEAGAVHPWAESLRSVAFPKDFFVPMGPPPAGWDLERTESC